GGQGFPQSGRFASIHDGAIFQVGPYGSNNALVLGRTFPVSATLTLNTPRAYTSISVLAGSANGGGQGNMVLRFSDGTQSPVIKFNAQDWYNTVTNVALHGFGRLRLGTGTLQTEHPSATNPNLYQTTVDLAAMGLNKEVSSILF